ncbi:unnamed protein product [Closterium sp. Naga37s-1]|nr:unnamed protein product [Closterium sp. Naga37s-1]
MLITALIHVLWALLEASNELAGAGDCVAVRAMASLRHEHVVRLLGFCLHQNVESGQQEQILVYEFVPNGDLKYHIHDSKTTMSLQQRLQLAVGAAEGVAFGVVLLELLTKQRTNVEGTNVHIRKWATRKVQAYEFSSLKDAALEAPEDAVVEFADIALDCVKVPGSRRPPMKDVARRLQALLSKYCSEGTCNPHEPSTRMTETMEESLEKLTGGGTGGDMDTFGKIDISEEL